MFLPKQNARNQHNERPARQRERRGWGPFSSGHLTIIIVTFATLLLWPVGAWAAYTVSHVTITDNAGVNTANVDAGHHLLVGDGTGSLTVDGTVSGRPVAPLSPFQFNNDISTLTFQFVVGPAAVSTAINVTSLTVSVPANENGDVLLRGFVQPGTATTCSTAGSSVPIWHARNITGNLTVSFPTSLQARPATGSKMCLAVYSTSSSVVLVSGSGFFGN
jgi:hypothetical protein